MNTTTIAETVKNYLSTAEIYPVLNETDKILFRYDGCQYITDGYMVTELMDDPDFPEVDIDMDFEEALEFIASI